MEQATLLQEEKPFLKQNQILQVQLTESQEEIKLLKEEVFKLRNIIRQLKKGKFVSAKESYTVPVEQLPLFNEVEELCDKPALPAGGGILEEVKGYKRKKGRGKREPFPEELEREDVIIDIPDTEKSCSCCGSQLKEIGEEVTEKLKTIPARTTIIRERKKKYACKSCSGNVIQAKRKSLIPGSIVTPELISYILFSKFFQGLPLYRLEELYKLQKIEVHRGTMARWLMQTSDMLIPVWNMLEERALESGYMAIDATRVQVLKEEGRKATTKSCMWVRGSPERGIALFDYNVSEGGAAAKGLMTGYEGALQGDGHKGYGVFQGKEILMLGCMMHARRKFYKAWESGGKKKEGMPVTALQMIKKIYKYEQAYKEKGLKHEERKQAREKEVRPYMERLKSWCEKKLSKTLPKSDLGIAMKYFLNEYERLSGFLKSGRYEIDNGWVERVIRKFAIGRNNWLFSDTVKGAKASSVLYSLVLTAKLNDKCPYKVMTEVLQRLPGVNTVEGYEALADLFQKEDGTNSVPSTH